MEVNDFDRRRLRIVILTVIILLLIVAAARVAITVVGKQKTGTESESWADWIDQSLEMDANAQEGGLTYRSQEEIQAELNRKVEEGMINISMNTSPVFPSGTEKGNLLIVNSESNRYPQIVYIVRKDTSEEIYRSKSIAVGSRIEYAALDVDLPAGVYDCVAYFNNADPDTGAMLGTAGAEITVTVEN